MIVQKLEACSRQEVRTLYSPALSRRTLLGAALALSGSALVARRSAFAAQSATPVAGGSFPQSLLDRAYDPGVSIASDMALIATSTVRGGLAGEPVYGLWCGRGGGSAA